MTEQMDARQPRRKLAVPSRAAFVWVYVIGLSILAAVAWRVLIQGDPAHSTPHVPWWAVALGFAAGEICVVHVRFRRSAHSFSLADLPFVFGLVFATGDGFVLGALVGTGLVLAILRRLEPVKVVFNVAQLALAACAAACLLRLVAGDASAL